MSIICIICSIYFVYTYITIYQRNKGHELKENYAIYDLVYVILIIPNNNIS